MCEWKHCEDMRERRREKVERRRPCLHQGSLGLWVSSKRIYLRVAYMVKEDFLGRYWNFTECKEKLGVRAWGGNRSLGSRPFLSPSLLGCLVFCPCAVIQMPVHKTENSDSPCPHNEKSMFSHITAGPDVGWPQWSHPEAPPRSSIWSFPSFLPTHLHRWLCGKCSLPGITVALT